MQLPVIIPEIDQQRYSCHGCTDCCRELVVFLTDADRQRIDRAQWDERLEIEPYLRMHGGYVLNHNADGACVFLTDEGRCRIHEELGGAEKPLACQLFPFSLERDGDKVRAGLRFDCPTVTVNDGAPLPSHRRDLDRMTKELAESLPQALRDTPDHLALTKTLRIEEEAVQKILMALDRLVTRRQLPLTARLRALCDVVHQLQAARLNNLDQEQLCDLTIMLVSELEDRAMELPVPQRPRERWNKILRQSAFAHGEYATFEQALVTARPSIAYRWQQLKRAVRMARGRGRIPTLACGTSEGTFEALQGLPASLSNRELQDVDNLITRYLQARITNRGGFGRAYYGWPLLAGLQATLLAVALIGWFARWSAVRHGKQSFGLSDVRAAVGIVDRAVGRAPELGARTAELRIGYLAGERAFSSLVESYAVA